MQQNFDVVGGLNPIQIETEDDRIINIFKKCKNVVYKITPLCLLFPTSLKNDTKQTFITLKELIGVKKINFKWESLRSYCNNRFR